MIENKNLHIQRFQDPLKNDFPYASNTNEIIAFNSIKDSNTLTLIWTSPVVEHVKNDYPSLKLIGLMLGHECEGGLYQCLRSKNLINEIEYNVDSDSMKTITI